MKIVEWLFKVMGFIALMGVCALTTAAGPIFFSRLIIDPTIRAVLMIASAILGLVAALIVVKWVTRSKRL